MKWFKHPANDSQYQSYVYAFQTNYLIKSGGVYIDGFVKIGIATDVERRLKAIQVGCPFELRIHSSIVCYSEEQARALESFIHRKLSKSQSFGEWFRLTTFVTDFLSRDFRALGVAGNCNKEGGKNALL